MKKNHKFLFKSMLFLAGVSCISLPFVSMSCKNTEKEKQEYKKSFVSFWEKQVVQAFNENNSFYEQNKQQLQNKKLKGYLEQLKSKIDSYVNDWNEMKNEELKSKSSNFNFQKITNFSNNVKNVTDKFQQLVNLSKDIVDTSDFYEQHYSKLLNNDLKKYYKRFSEEIEKYINSFFEYKVNQTNDVSSWSNNWNDKESIKTFYKDITEWTNDYKSDSWLVFDTKDSFNADNYNKITPYIEVEKNKFGIFKFDYVNEYMFKKLANVLNITDKELRQDFTDEELKQTEANMHLYYDIVKKYIPQLINKNWSTQQKALALSKFLMVKNNYNTTNYKKNYHFLGMKENEFSEFNCQGISEFLYIAFDILGYQDIYLNNHYYKVKDNSYLEHINFSIKENDVDYVVDTTFGDRMDNWDNNWIWKDNNNWNSYETNKQTFKESVFAPKTQWMQLHNFYWKSDVTRIERK
ncbi:hypothetical protein [[Mycoplasma] gypis]|uniref:Lipoprotein n=1 Tax=[Mycoplasma] gypis TaxID=92404 RepID=A0ABZ2RTW5_9BACT|nr:hypothetical protein [[Mycoplasma] gypis]MBN0919382.1 hypothetical protein [[Mycoplasma] gypis]